MLESRDHGATKRERSKLDALDNMFFPRRSDFSLTSQKELPRTSTCLSILSSAWDSANTEIPCFNGRYSLLYAETPRGKARDDHKPAVTEKNKCPVLVSFEALIACQCSDTELEGFRPCSENYDCNMCKLLFSDCPTDDDQNEATTPRRPEGAVVQDRMHISFLLAAREGNRPE